MSEISGGRKAAYYLGGMLMVIGILMFLSTFVLFMANFGNFGNFAGMAKQTFFLAIGGMSLMAIGGIVRGVGACGVAGSGLKLDPDQAREDLKPYSHMAGRMIGDALGEIAKDTGDSGRAVVVKVKCAKCKALNEEKAKFCSQCGAAT